MTQNDKQLNTFIVKFYASKFFSMLAFIIPFVAVMFDKNGLTATQIAICMMAQQLIQFATEIPSGVIADRYSRRNVLISSEVSVVIALMFWLFMPYFWGYLIGYGFFGLWGSLKSGCEEAFIYDELKKYEKRNLFEKVRGRSNALTSAGILIASLMSAYLVKKGFDFNFLIISSIIAVLIGIFFLCLITPARKIKNTEEVKNVLSYMQILKKGFKYSWRHTTVAKLILFVAFAKFINVGFIEYSEIFYNELTNDLAKVAIIFGAMEIMYIIGNLSGFFWRNFFVRFLIIFYLITACLDIVAFNLYVFPVSLLIVMFNSMIVSGIDITMSARTNDFIPSSVRATILSVRGFIKSLGTLISLFAFGRVVDHFESYRIGFLTFAYLFTIGSAIFTIIFWMDKHLRKREKRIKLNLEIKKDFIV